MSFIKKVHVLDGNSARRARITFALGEGRFRTQIYEDLKELSDWRPVEGLVLLNQDAGCEIGDIQRMLKAQGASLPIAVYSQQPSTIKIVRAMLEGALDYLEWPFDASKLERTFRKIDKEFSPHLQRQQKQSEAAALVATLSGRERSVLELLISGQSNKGIARELGISPRTVEIHRANMMAKLNAQSSSDAVRIGIYAGLDQ